MIDALALDSQVDDRSLEAYRVSKPVRGPGSLVLDTPTRPTEEETATTICAWAARHDPTGDLHELLMHVAQSFSAPREWLELIAVDNLDDALNTLTRHGFIESMASGDDADRGTISMVAGVRQALAEVSAQHFGPRLQDHHRAAAQDSAERSDSASQIFHLARAGQHSDALAVLIAQDIQYFSGASHLARIRAALSEVDLFSVTDSLDALSRRLLISIIPPQEPVHVRDAIQDVLRRAEKRAAMPLGLDMQLNVTVAHGWALIRRGRYEEAYLHGHTLAQALRGMPWLKLNELGIGPSLLWAAQATGALLKGDLVESSRKVSVALEFPLHSGWPFPLYTAMTAQAAVTAQRGELHESSRCLADAQVLYRRSGWPPSITQVPEFIARFFLACAALDLEGVTQLRNEISELHDPDEGLYVLNLMCECVVQLHSGLAAHARVSAMRVLRMVRDDRAGGLFRIIGTKLVFFVFMILGRPAVALELVENTISGDGECNTHFIAAAHLALGDARRALAVTDSCIGLSLHHSTAGESLMLLVRAGAQQMLGNEKAAAEIFEEAFITQRLAPMLPIFLLLSPQIRATLGSGLAAAEHATWVEIEQLLAGSLKTMNQVEEELPPGKLTSREMVILRELSDGGTLAEIAAAHFVSRNTVKTHVRLLYKKLGVSSRDAAIEMLRRFENRLLK